eukprot:Gb_12317 [translate_table: standard]
MTLQSSFAILKTSNAILFWQDTNQKSSPLQNTAREPGTSLAAGDILWALFH